MNDGGPAFPCYTKSGSFRDSDGLTVRDYFAAAALQGMVSDSKGLAITGQEFARSSYDLADAMLKERDKNHDRTR